MKKVLFLMFLLFLCLGTANVNAQVRIGGNASPNAAAVLDLNATDDATPAGNKGALALPRVSLSSTTAQLNGATPITGMLVYNTNELITGGNGVGIYYWVGGSWHSISIVPKVGSLAWLALVLDTTINTPTVTTFSQWSAISPTSLWYDICMCSSGWGVAATNGHLYFTGGPSSAVAGMRLKCFRLIQ